MPRCFPYHSYIFWGSLALKKIPPRPITRFVFSKLIVFSASAVNLKILPGFQFRRFLAILALLAITLTFLAAVGLPRFARYEEEGSTRPESLCIVLSDRLQLRSIWLRRWPRIRRDLQFPSRIRQHIIHAHARMIRRKKRLRVVAKAQHAFSRNHRRRPAARQPHALAPSCTVAIPRAGNVAYFFRQAMLAMLQQRHKPLRHRRDIARATRARQPHHAVLALHLRRIQVAILVHFGRAQKSQVHP